MYLLQTYRRLRLCLVIKGDSEDSEGLVQINCLSLGVPGREFRPQSNETATSYQLIRLRAGLIISKHA